MWYFRFFSKGVVGYPPHRYAHEGLHAEGILEAAKEHVMKEVFSASSLTAARPLLCFSYRKLQWLRRLLSYDGKKHRVMHPEYSTMVPSFPTIPEMKADEADMLKGEGGGSQQEDGRGAVCKDLDRTLSQGVAQKAKRGELASRGTQEDPHIFMWAGDGFIWLEKRGSGCSWVLSS